MNHLINTKVISEAVKNKQLMPYFLDDNNTMLFKENMQELYSVLDDEDFRTLFYKGQKIEEKVWNETKFVGSLFTTLFSNWVKIIKRSSSLFLEVNPGFPESVSVDLADTQFVVFYRAQEGMISKRDECILKVKPDWINSFFDWLYNEIMEEGSIDEVADKYKAFIEVFVGENEIVDDTFQLSPEFYENLDIMKDSIIAAMDEDGSFDDNDDIDFDGLDDDTELNTPENQKSPYGDTKTAPISIDFTWNGNPSFLAFPLAVNTALTEKFIHLENLDTPRGWLAQQSVEVQETVVALWADYVFTSYAVANEETKAKLELNWSGFSEYVRDWLRQDCYVDAKKIEKKVNTTYHKITQQNKIVEFDYADTPEKIMRVLLYIDNMGTIASNKYPLINVENVQTQYFYALNNNNVLMQLWAGITQEKLQKKRTRSTVSSQFETLKDKFPNFKEVIEYYSGAMYIFEQTGTPPAPVLLLGSPGLGKTHFSNELAKVVGSMMTVIPISSLSAGWVISGAAAQWKDAQMGKVATALLNGTTMSPVIVLDEIDKKSEGNFDPLGALYPLLEYQTAKEFVDEYLEFPLDASNIIWVATSNSLTRIPEPILDRFVVFDIVKLNKQDTIKVANYIYADLTRGLAPQALSEEILEILSDKTPRQIKQILKKALAYAAVQRTQKIVLEKQHLDLKTTAKKIGF